MTVRYQNDTEAASADDPAVTPAAGTASSRPGPREDLGRYAELGGFTLTADTHPWYAAIEAIGSPDDARAASTVLAELRSRDVLATRAAVTGLVAQGSLDEPDSVVALGLVVGVLRRVHSTSAKLRAEAYDADLEALTAATADSRWRREQGVKLSWGRRRALRAQAKLLTLGGRTRRADLHEALAAAVKERADWTALAGAAADTSAVRPVVTADAARLAEAAQAVEALAEAVRALGRLLPGRELETTPLAELADLVDRLAADEGTLYRLPTLGSLRTELENVGLAELFDELTESRADREAALAVYDRRTAIDPADTADGADTEEDAVEAARQALAAGPRTGTEEAPAVEPEIPAARPEAVITAAESPVAEVEVEVVAEVEAAVDAAVEPEIPAARPEAVITAAEDPGVEAEVVTEVEAVLAPAPEVEIPAARPEVAAEPAAETSAVVAAGESTEEPAAAPVAEVAEPADPVAETGEKERPKRVRRPKKPSLTVGQPITAYTPGELRSLVRWIDSDGVERTDDQLLRAATKELGFARLGPRIKEALGAAVTEARN
ncbi:hypothetical protein [Kitasatospora sp. GP82]|uniref:hypothetical protein n=1 Tax=Kitasatospora sp. GP82 TaxID=3035089 RepID=UPI002473D13E|nr:hypothetical protein [Kitasatospora sp. GP82]MDH6125652.1 hypothetical protein [Kitasatospora sp. GP82]